LKGGVVLVAEVSLCPKEPLAEARVEALLAALDVQLSMGSVVVKVGLVQHAAQAEAASLPTSIIANVYKWVVCMRGIMHFVRSSPYVYIIGGWFLFFKSGENDLSAVARRTLDCVDYLDWHLTQSKRFLLTVLHNTYFERQQKIKIILGFLIL
jgi:hypothetical protein